MPDARVRIEREWKGLHSGFAEPAELLIRTREEWQAVWGKIHRLRLPPPNAPAIDFAEKMVIAVFLGERSGGGAAVEITSIQQDPQEIVVDFEESAPSSDSLQTMAQSQPYHLVLVNRLDLPVRFQARRLSHP